MSDLLIEIGTEELPPGVIEPALSFIKERLREILGREDVETFGTPRRLAFLVRNFVDEKEVREEIVFGPPWKVSFDEEGKPTKALEGFLKRHGAEVEDVFKARKGKGEYAALKIVSEEESLLQKLSHSFEDILLSVPFPRRMRWTASRKLSFSRPIRWILALHGDRVIDLSFGDLRADRKTKGHRFLSQGWLEIERAEGYLEKLEKHHVVPSIEKRREMILSALAREAERVGGVPEYPSPLVDEVTQLVEYPFPVLGRFEERFLELPERVIVTVCAHHQRFFCVARDGKLTSYFIGISNNLPRTDLIRRGYEKVLRARLEDALFFYREDLKRRLDDLVPRLSGVLIHPKIGTVLEKVERLRRVVEKLCGYLRCSPEVREKALRSAYLSKADLLTEMVKEFDELQGYMGYVYALAQGEDEEVALALFEQYKPRGAEDETPRTLVGALLSLADKIDDLFSFFRIGEIPTGGSDPFGLRRSAFGLLRIIDERKWDLDLGGFRDIYGSGAWEEELEAFLAGRIESYMEGVRYDLIRAVLSVASAFRPYEVIRRIRALERVKDSPLLRDLYEAYRRAVKIIPEGWENARVQEELLKEKEELALWNALRELERRGEVSLEELAQLRKPLDEFFDRVLVMDRDERIRTNRLALLTRLKLLFNRIADFSKLVPLGGAG